MKNIFKKLWLALLVFLPQLAFASDTTFGFNMNNLFSVSPSDYSVIFLKRIFGDIGFNLSVMAGSQQRTIFGELFRVFNLGILTIAAIVMMFTIIKVVMETSHSGEIMGKQKNNAWLVFRTSVGLAALVPSVSGYSFLQALVMWFILQGIGFANSAWGTCLDYLQNHGLLYVTSSQMSNQNMESSSLAVDQDLVSYQINSKDSAHGAADSMMLSMSCMYNLEYAIKDTLNNKKADMDANPDNYNKDQVDAMNRLQDYFIAGAVKPKYDNDKKLLLIPDAIPQEDQDDWVTVFGTTPTIKIANVGSACGVYSWKVPASRPGQDVSGYEEAKKTGLQWQVDNFGPTSKRLVALSYSDKEKPPQNQTTKEPQCNSQECQALLAGASQYQTAVYSERLAFGSESNDTKDDQWFLDAKNEGWSMAGRYYYDLARLNDPTKSKLDYEYYLIDTASAALTEYYNNGTQCAAWITISDVLNGVNDSRYTNALQRVFNYTYTVSNNAIKKAIEMNNNAKAEAAGTEVQDLRTSQFFAGKTGESFNPGNLGHGDTLTPMLNSHVEVVVDTWLKTMRDQTDKDGNPIAPDPIVNLMIVGDSMTTEASGIWNSVLSKFTAMAASFGASTVIPIGTGITGISVGNIYWGSTAGAAITGSGGIAATVLQLVAQITTSIAFLGLPLVIAVTTPMYVTGMMLSVYIPLIPFMIFTLGVISWLILVIEAMVAAPLVALGLTHPEGHDLLGKSEQAVMLLLNVFIRPICMIIGLMAAMVLSYIALTVLNAGFGSVVDAIFTSASDYSSNSIKSILILVVYTFIVMALVNQCFSLIYIVGDKIGTWIGMPAQPSDIEKHLGETKQGMQQGMQEGAGGIGQATSGAREMGSAAAGGTRIGGDISQMGKGIHKGYAEDKKRPDHPKEVTAEKNPPAGDTDKKAP